MLIYTDYEQKILELVRRLTTTSTLGALQNQRVVLGGTTGSGGGAGGPFQPFIGKLVQTSVAYDTSEFAQIAMPTGTSASLLDNLNHIRAAYSIKPLYTPTNYTVPSGQDSTLMEHLEGIDGSLAWSFDTINVDPRGKADYTDISSALVTATTGDVVLTGPGVYIEDFTIPAGVALIGLGRTGISVSGCVTIGSGSWFENFQVSASGTHAVIIPAGTSGANLVNLDARTVGIDYYALSASGNARVTEGRYYTYGNSLTQNPHLVAVPSGIAVLLDDPEILNSGVEGIGWGGKWYDKDRKVVTKKQTHIIDADGTLSDVTTKFNTLLDKLESAGVLEV